MDELDGSIAEWTLDHRRRRAARAAARAAGCRPGGSTAPRTCSPTRTSRPGRRSSGSPHPELGELAMQNVAPKLSATPGAGPVTWARRSASTTKTSTRACWRLDDDGDVVAALRRRHLKEEPWLPAGRRRRRHLHRHPARRRGVRCDLPRQDPVHPRRTSPSGSCEASKVSARPPASHSATSARCSTALPSRRTRSWKARERASVWSPPRDSGRCCRSPGPSCPVVWRGGSSGPSPSRWPPSRTPSRPTGGSPPTGRSSPSSTRKTPAPNCVSCRGRASRPCASPHQRLCQR